MIGWLCSRFNEQEEAFRVSAEVRTGPLHILALPEACWMTRINPRDRPRVSSSSHSAVRTTVGAAGLQMLEARIHRDWRRVHADHMQGRPRGGFRLVFHEK